MTVPPLVAPGPPLTAAQRERFARHVLLPQVGEVGQRRLLAARVCVIGAGGLGAPVLQYLAAAGVGRIGIVDDDVVDVTNLQRQVVHGTADVGRLKVTSAAEAVHTLAPDTEVVQHAVRLTAANADLLADYDVVVDGTDNFPTRYLVNDACVRLGLPEVWGSVFRFDAQVSVFWGTPPEGVPAVQLRDLFPTPPPEGSVPSCAVGGVLGAMCGIVGSVMAAEVVKLVTGAGRPLLGRIAVLDALAATWSEVALRGAPAVAPIDGQDRQDGRRVGEQRVESMSNVTGGSGIDRGSGTGEVGAVTAPELADWLSAGTVTLLDVREPAERAIVTIPGDLAIPLGDLAERWAEVPTDRPVVVYCHSGRRSARAAELLAGRGYEALNLTGGVLAWADLVDPSLPRY